MPARHYLQRHEMNTTPKVKTGEWLDPRGNPVIEVNINGQYVALLSVATAEGLIKRLQREVDSIKANDGHPCAVCGNDKDHKRHVIGNKANDGTHKYV